MGVVLVKLIKPKRFKDDEVKRILRNAVRRAGTQVVNDFKLTTATWDHMVEWIVRTHISQTLPSPSIEVWTEDPIYRYVDEGTKPHPIFAGIYTGKSDKKALSFPSAFAPKTKPRVLGSGAGMKGGPLTVVPYVQHPGTEAREFSKMIVEKRTPWFKREMEDALREAVQASGHQAK
jgi:hypothetical protein